MQLGRLPLCQLSYSRSSLASQAATIADDPGRLGGKCSQLRPWSRPSWCPALGGTGVFAEHATELVPVGRNERVGRLHEPSDKWKATDHRERSKDRNLLGDAQARGTARAPSAGLIAHVHRSQKHVHPWSVARRPGGRLEWHEVEVPTPIQAAQDLGRPSTESAVGVEEDPHTCLTGRVGTVGDPG